MKPLPAAVAALLCLLVTPAARAQHAYADPPDGSVGATPYPPDRPQYPSYGDPSPYLPESSIRVLTGPGLRVSEYEPDAGLFAAVDVGKGAAGLRVTGTWMSSGPRQGLSAYTGELWLDLARDQRLHPMVGAGAGVARLEAPIAGTRDSRRTTLGFGLLRLGLSYQLPVAGTDARAGLDVMGCLPAIRDQAGPPVRPWAVVVASVGVGF
jgi:hypothetical protein